MPVVRHDSLAGKLLQKHAALPPVGASLLAICCMRTCPLFGTIRLQASSHKKHAALPPVGASLLAICCMRTCPMFGTIRLQASSYKNTLPLQSNLNSARPVLLELRSELAKAPRVQRQSNLAHEVEVVVQVVDAGQHGAQHFAAAVQVVQVGA